MIKIQEVHENVIGEMKWIERNYQFAMIEGEETTYVDVDVSYKTNQENVVLGKFTYNLDEYISGVEKFVILSQIKQDMVKNNIMLEEDELIKEDEMVKEAI